MKSLISVIVCLFLVLGVAELGVRRFVLPRSQSANTVLGARARGASLNEAHFNVAVFGNSYTLCGVDFQLLEMEAAKQDTDIAVHALNGSYALEWYWLVEHCYLNSDVRPDVVVLNVGKTSLIDRGVINHRRLALNFGIANRPAVPIADLQQEGKFCEFFISRYSMLINRGRNVGEQLAMRVVPAFTAMTSNLKNRKQQQNRLATAAKPPPGEPQAQVKVAERTFKALRDQEVKCVVVLMPHREHYELDAPLRELLDEYATIVHVIDHRDCTEIAQVDFKDAVHMNSNGQLKYSPIYASAVLELIEGLKR